MKIKENGKKNEISRVVVFDSDAEKNDFGEVVMAILDEIVDSIPDDIGMPIHLENEIEKVTFNDPATVVFWKDGTKTVSKCKPGDSFNKETGLAMCIIRKLCGNRSYNKVFEKYCS